jgi:hypothetical protein
MARVRGTNLNHPSSRIFDILIGVAAAAIVGLAALAATGYFDVATPYGNAPVPHRSTARNRCQSLALEKLPDDADVAFSDEKSDERLHPDRSWVIRGPIEVEEGNGDRRRGEYVCDHLRELPAGSDHWNADQVLVLGV